LINEAAFSETRSPSRPGRAADRPAGQISTRHL
jgi:hypothetical protein